MSRILWGAMLLAAALGLFPWLTAPVFAAQLRLGDIGKQPAEQTRTFAPFVSYVAGRLKAEGIDQGRVVVFSSIPEMAAALREEKIDLFMDSVFPAMGVVRLGGAKLLLRRWKNDVAEYHSMIIVRKDSGIRRVEELVGKTLAFEEPFSTTAYFFPKAALTQKGLKLREMKGPSDKVGADEVGYIFVGEDPNAMHAVLKGRVSAGAMGSQALRYASGPILDALHVIHESAPLPRHVVGYRAELPARLVARIKDILVNMDKTDEGRKILKHMENTARFDEIPAGSLAEITKSLPLVDAEFGTR